MGGFAGGLAGVMGGAAQGINEAAQHRVQHNIQMLQIWQDTRDKIADHLASLIASNGGQYRADLVSTLNKVMGAKPGTDVGGLLQQVTDHTTVHPSGVQAYQAANKPPTQSTTGAPAGRGQVPGTTTTPPNGNGSTPPDAQPLLSPVQPQAQTSTPAFGGFSQGTSSLAPPPMAAPSLPTTPAGAPPQGTQPVQPPDYPMSPEDRAAIDLENYFIQHGGYVPQYLSQRTATIHAGMSKFAEDQALANRRMSNLQGLRGTREFQDLPGYLKISPIEEAYGFQPGSMTGMGTMMRPQSKAADAATLERQFPGILAKYGIDAAKTPAVTATWSPMDMFQQGPPMMVEGVTPQNVAITNADNTKTFVPRTPGAAGVAPSQATPRLTPLEGGGAGLISPSTVAAGGAPTPIPGAVVPSLQTHTASTSTEPTMSGGTATQRVTTVGGGPAKSGTAPAGGAPKPKASVWGNVGPFNDSTPVDHIARLIAQDAANEKMISTRGPFSVENPSRAMVNKRLAELGLDPNNVSGSVRDRAAVANTVLPHMDDIESLLHQATIDGDLGVVMTRLNDLATGKVGIDPTKGQIFSKLATNLTFVSSAIGMTHGGTRAASSLPMVEHWTHALGAKDPTTLLSELGEARKWMQGYAQMAGSMKPVNTGGPSGTNMPPATGGNPNPNGYTVGHKYGGLIYLGGDANNRASWK